MTIHDLRCPDGELATELGWRVVVGGRHSNENRNVTVCGGQAGLWSVVGFLWTQLGIDSPVDGPKPRSSALWNRQYRRTLAKRGCTS